MDLAKFLVNNCLNIIFEKNLFSLYYKSMKLPFYFMLSVLFSVNVYAQKLVFPGSGEVNTSKLIPGKSLYIIYYVKDTSWTKKGSFTHELSVSGSEIKLVADYKDEANKWYKKTISVADGKTMAPISYQFEGPKNTFKLTFGATVNGKLDYFDNRKDQSVSFSPKEKYVDYNLSEHLFTTLPLKTGYTARVPEFYYDGKSDKVITYYTIKEVKSYVHRSPKTGNHECWLVTVLEESSGAIYNYVIDKQNHAIWQREMSMGKGMWEICVNDELDYQPIKNKFNKEEALAKVEKGNSVILGTAFARDHSSRGIAIVNINKAQYPPKGTVVSILLNSPYIQEWKEVNKKIKKGKKLPEVPIDPNVSACIKTTKVYDNQGHFEFTNLMPGEYLLMTSFGYTHSYTYSYYAGTSYLMHPSGAVLSSSPVYNTASASTGANANIETVVTIKENGEQLKVSLKDVR